MKKVTDLKSKRVDCQTIETIKELLEKAEAGELQSLMFIDKHSNGEVGHGWAGKPNKKMIGELEDLKFNFLSQMYFPMEEETSED